MKTGIVGVINNPATSINSHSAGMVNIVSKLFNADVLTENDNWDEYERLIIYHGVNFVRGSYNIIGGMNDKIICRAGKVAKFNGHLYSLDGFQLNDFSNKRKLKLYDNHATIAEIELPHRDKLLIGDSHSVSVWRDISFTIQRMDGKTLYGFLKNPIVADYYYFGNIDVRFHLARQVDPIDATKDLVKRYIAHAKINNATVTCLLPVENEDRKIPSTGLYKKKPFYGSRELRSRLVEVFNSELLSSGLVVHQWPIRWYDDISYYQSEVMEPKQSVHIRPKYYANNI
mgnify:CR=1 FL=1|jgi:hypothetical protein